MARPAATTVKLPLALIALAAVAASAASEPRPVVATKTNAIEASIVIDPALRAYPGLYDRLFASAEREYDKAREGAVQDFKETPGAMDRGPYFYKRTDRLRSAVGAYVSVVESEETFTGGAHPNYTFDTLLWDSQSRRFVNIKPFFKEFDDNGPALTAMARLVRAALAAEKKSRGVVVGDPDSDQWISYVSPKIGSIGAIALAPSTERGKSSGLLVYFSPYAVGPFAEGDYAVFVPYAGFASALSAQGEALFGGTRPAGDAKNDER